MQRVINVNVHNRTSNEIWPLYTEFLSLLAKRRDEFLGFGCQSRWDLGRVGADPDFNYERSIQLLDSDFVEARRYKSQREKLMQIKAAIHRMKDGIYGICIHCFAPMSMTELRQEPEKSFCSKCMIENHPQLTS